jgi:hypothetical protein
MAIQQWARINISRRLPALRVQEHPSFEFAFCLEPIVQLTAWLFAAFAIDFACAMSDFLITRRVPYGSLSPLRGLGRGRVGPGLPFPFGFDDILIFDLYRITDASSKFRRGFREVQTVSGIRCHACPKSSSRS